jgi:hypothetical protein
MASSVQANPGVVNADPQAAAPLRRLHILRLTLVFFALCNVAAHVYATPGATPITTWWIDVEIATYGLTAVIYLFGLRMFYWPVLLFSAFTIVMYFLSGAIPMGLIDPKPLVGHLQILQYSFGRGFSMISWVFLLIVGWIMLKLDPGSRVNDLLAHS